jgi:hypothetical protein
VPELLMPRPRTGRPRGRPRLGEQLLLPPLTIRLPPGLRERLKASARPGEGLAGAVRRLLDQALTEEETGG